MNPHFQLAPAAGANGYGRHWLAPRDDVAKAKLAITPD
jgi:hypothetical protein